METIKNNKPTLLVAHLQNRSSRPASQSFAKEPPSQRSTKTDKKSQQNRRQKKKGEGITSPIRKQGFRAS